MPGAPSIPGTTWESRPSAVVLIPVKAFHQAKGRLAPALPPGRRAALAREMGRRVLLAARPLPVAVVCDDPEVASWAGSLGARVIWEPGRGLNLAVTSGVARLAAEGVARVTVAHADLPLANGLGRLGQAWLTEPGGSPGRLRTRVEALQRVILVPDRHLDGTNVACIPTGAGFCFSYGPGSFRRHCQEARRLGLELEILDRPDLAWDIDRPDDLADLTASSQGAHFLSEAL